MRQVSQQCALLVILILLLDSVVATDSAKTTGQSGAYGRVIPGQLRRLNSYHTEEALTLTEAALNEIRQNWRSNVCPSHVPFEVLSIEKQALLFTANDREPYVLSYHYWDPAEPNFPKLRHTYISLGNNYYMTIQTNGTHDNNYNNNNNNSGNDDHHVGGELHQFSFTVGFEPELVMTKHISTPTTHMRRRRRRLPSSATRNSSSSSNSSSSGSGAASPHATIALLHLMSYNIFNFNAHWPQRLSLLIDSIIAMDQQQQQQQRQESRLLTPSSSASSSNCCCCCCCSSSSSSSPSPPLPDIIGFQEVRFDSGRFAAPATSREFPLVHPNHQIEHLKHALLPLGYAHYVHQPAMNYFERLAPPLVRDEEGLAIFSRHPILETSYIMLTRDPWDHEDYHQRICLRALVEMTDSSAGGAPTRVNFFNVHMSLSHSAQLRNVLEIWHFVNQFNHQSDIQVLVGDFNAEPENPAIKFLLGQHRIQGETGDFVDAWVDCQNQKQQQQQQQQQQQSKQCDAGYTFPTFPGMPRKRIDFILVRRTTTPTPTPPVGGALLQRQQQEEPQHSFYVQDVQLVGGASSTVFIQQQQQQEQQEQQEQQQQDSNNNNNSNSGASTTTTTNTSTSTAIVFPSDHLGIRATVQVVEVQKRRRRG